jgi:hypothetical protein
VPERKCFICGRKLSKRPDGTTDGVQSTMIGNGWFCPPERWEKCSEASLTRTVADLKGAA